MRKLFAARNWGDFPFSPAKLPFHYGWVILLSSALAAAVSVPGQTIGVAVFTDPLIDVLALTRVQLSTAYMLGSILSSLLLTHAGQLYDRIGARLITAAACFFGGGVLLLLTRIEGLAGLVASLTGLAASTAAFVTVTAGFFGLRFLFIGLMPMISSNMLAKWFEQRRGLAVGFCGVVVALSFSAAPLLFDRMIQAYSWQGAWTIMAVVVGIGVTFYTLLFFRETPQQCGLNPDLGRVGRPVEEDSRGACLSVRQFTLLEARKSYAFWMYTVSMAMFGLYFTGMTFHIVSIFAVAGMTRTQAVAIFLPSSVLTVAVKIIGGWISDRINLKYLLMALLLGMAGSMLGLTFLTRGLPVLALVVGNGVAGGVMGLLMGVAWPRFFGYLNLGAIRGLSTSVLVFSSALGPFFFGHCHALTGSYKLAAIVALIATLLLLVGIQKADNPQDRLA